MDITQFSLIDWLIVLCGSLAVTLASVVYFTPKSEHVSQRIVSLSNIAKGNKEEEIKNKPFVERLLIMVTNFLQPVFEKQKNKTRAEALKMRLIRSGDTTTDPVQHWAKKILFSTIAILFGLMMGNYTVLAILAVLAFVFPDLQLKQNVDKRINTLRSELPNFIDLLSTTASSVPNLDEAIRIVCDRYDSQLSQEFRIVLGEISTGKRRRDALNDMAMRTGVNEIRSLVTQINQSEVFGTPVQRTLKDQAVKMRKVKRDVAEKRAASASSYLMMPMFFLLISILLVMMGPTVLQLKSVF